MDEVQQNQILTILLINLPSNNIENEFSFISRT